MKTLLVLVAVIVTGCVSRPNYNPNDLRPNFMPAQTDQRWVKPNSTEQEFLNDKYACLKEASGYTVMQTNYSLVVACLNARGYYLKQVEVKPGYWFDPKTNQVVIGPSGIPIK